MEALDLELGWDASHDMVRTGVLYPWLMALLYPLVFEPILVEKPWGGRALAALGKDLPTKALYGESWEVADLDPSDVSASLVSRTVVRNGSLRGKALQALIREFGPALLGSASPTADGSFPLLLKLLSAREHLSVQVHPTAEYVATHPGTFLKTESWFIVSAEPGAVIYLGFRSGVTMDQVSAAIGTSAMVPLMQEVPALVGEFHHLPAGTIHALGAGVLVAEPQTPSDTTFRLYDWVEEYERAPRALHLQQGLAVLDLAPKGLVSLPAMAGEGVRTLIETSHYWQREHSSSVPRLISLNSAEELRILAVLSGEVETAFAGSVVRASAGDTLVVPAACVSGSEVVFTGEGSLIETGLVSI